jgi:hypothetical protein
MAAKPSVKSKPAAVKKPAAPTKAKDLPAKKNAKGGGCKPNHNETWVGA